MKIIEVYDDLDWARSHTKTTATDTVTVVYDGTAVELDLSEANKKDLDERMGELLAAGRRITAKAAATPSSPPSFGSGARDLHRSRVYHKELRMWVDANHLTSQDGTRPAYITPSGAIYYPAWLYQRFENHRAASVR